MKILALVSSKRKKGNTARIVQQVEAHMQALAAQHKAPLEFETLYLGDMVMQPCLGCRACFDHGEERCPAKDDIMLIRAKMDTADGLILASPVYVNDVNGIAKTWIDRLACICHRPAMGGKYAFLIATVAQGPTGHALQTMNLALMTWGYHIVGNAGYKMGALLPQDELENRYQRETARVARVLFQAIHQQQALHPAFLSLMMFKIQQLAWQQEPPDTLDYAYWQAQGWIDPACTFYITHQANPVKVFLARLAGAVLHRFVA